MRTQILMMCLLTFVRCDDDDIFPVDDSGSSDNVETTTTTYNVQTATTTYNVETATITSSGGGGGLKYAVFGGIVGGLSVITGLVVLGRRMCRRAKKEKIDDEEYIKDLDYDYYGIMKRRLSSSVV